MKVLFLKRFAAIAALFLFSVGLTTAALAGDQTVTMDAQTQTAPTPSPAPSAASADENGWHFNLTPYLWFAGLSGTAGLRGHDVSVHASPGDLLSHFDIGLMGAFEARKNRWVIPVDFMWMKLEGDHTTPFDPGVSYAKLKITQTVFTPGIGYQVVNHEKFKVDAKVSIRYWYLGQNASFQPSGILSNFSSSASWVDVVAGAKIEGALTPKVVVTVFGDAGGGGANSDYQFGGLLGYRVSKKVVLQAGWRYLDVNYRNSAPQLFVYDAHQSGAIMGATFNLK